MAKLAIIGAGASGLIAASVAAELSCAYNCGHNGSSGLEICIFEATDKIGRPILKSGNGRCNLTNSNITSDEYHNSRFAEQVLNSSESLFGRLNLSGTNFQYPDNLVASYFEQHGVILREEADGRLYPQVNKASAVLDVLKRSISRFGVDVKLGTPISVIDEPDSAGVATWAADQKSADKKSTNKRPTNKITFRDQEGKFFRADYVIVATGGRSSQGCILPFVDHVSESPVLGSIATENKLVKHLDNIRVRCRVSLRDQTGRIKASELGEVMFRKYGVSGIAVFNLSRSMAPGDRIVIDFIPQISDGEMRGFLEKRMVMLQTCLGAQPTNFDMLNGIVLPAVADVLLQYLGLAGDEEFSKDNWEKMANVLKSFVLECKGIGDEGLCQVNRGGYVPDSVDPKTMSLFSVSNIYLTGECLDVDGPCGGYNLHWAFLTGMLAAHSVVDSFIKGSTIKDPTIKTIKGSIAEESSKGDN